MDDRGNSLPGVEPAIPIPSGGWLIRLYDGLDRWRKGQSVRGILATVLVVAYLGSLAVIEAKRWGWLPRPYASRISSSHFVAIGIAFYLLVLTEIVGLIFDLANSVARSVGKQVEILSLILIRQSFEILSEFAEPIRWDSLLGLRFDNPLIDLIIDAMAALVIFILVGIYYRIQHEQPISEDARDQSAFINSKKVVALLLMVGMVVVTVRGAIDYVAVGGKSLVFFEELFSLLILSDVLIVLIALHYSASYRVVFRNSAFALATVLIRIGLTAPPPYNALLGVTAALYAVLLTLAYNKFAPILRDVRTASSAGDI